MYSKEASDDIGSIFNWIWSELSFLIKNLDTGEEIDARDETHIEIMLS